MKIILFTIILAFIGCDTFEALDSEVRGWLAESKAQRELLQREREALEAKEREINRKLEDDNLSPDEREELVSERTSLEEEKERLAEREREESDIELEEDKKKPCDSLKKIHTCYDDNPRNPFGMCDYMLDDANIILPSEPSCHILINDQPDFPAMVKCQKKHYSDHYNCE